MKNTTLFILLAMLGIAASAQIPSYIPTAGLLAWYPFTGNPNDSSGYMNNGTVYGGTTFGTDRFGNPNSCFVADSLSAIDFPLNDFPLGNAERTVSIFYKLDSPYARHFRELFAWGDNSFAGSRFGLEIVDDTGIGWESTGCGVLSHFTADTFWHNLVVTYPTAGTGSSSIKLYLDGELASVTSIVSPVSILNTASGFIHTAGSLFVSGYLYGFYGSLDDLAVWDHELTSCEIEKIFYGPASLAPVITTTGKKLHTDSTYSSYQWILNGTPISGATTDSFTMTHGGMYKVAVTTKGGCLDTSVIYTTTLNTPGLSSEAISIYPNPSTGLFLIESTEPVNMILTSIEGRVIEQKNHATQIDIRHYPTGIYIVSLFDENGMRIKTERINRTGN